MGISGWRSKINRRSKNCLIFDTVELLPPLKGSPRSKKLIKSSRVNELERTNLDSRLFETHNDQSSVLNALKKRKGSGHHNADCGRDRKHL